VPGLICFSLYFVLTIFGRSAQNESRDDETRPPRHKPIAAGIDGTRGGEKDTDSGEGRDQKDAAGGKDGIEGDGPDRGGEGRDRESGGEASAVQKTRKFEVVSRHRYLFK